MGIKDNFQQAVKELWKKDGQGETPANDAAGGTTLDQYLKQDNTEQKPIQVSEGDTVPLETPYYRTPEQNAAAAGKAAGTTQSSAAQPAQQAAQYADDQSGRGYTQADQGYTQADQGYSQADRSYPQADRGYTQAGQGYAQAGSGYSQSAQSSQQGYGQSSSFQGGYRAENPGNYNVSRSLGNGGNGGYVPPEQGGGYVPQSSSENDEVTVISKNTSIDGNIRSLANMHIDGNIKGNVETTKNVEMTGKIVGDITCNNAGMNSAGMQGNISLKGRMIMDRDTILIGDLSSQYADINGRIRGKLDIVGKAELKRDAIVFGDINASTIAVTDGAIIQGYVNTTFLSKEDSRNVFPDAISLESKGNPNGSSNG